ncbi:hypothetical protein SKAU_G00173570 [Synaphobranchus kaupii]|uniref:Opioid growth factor receptor (OGFr) conserved domain-containing protein n=1 Tax=Synaphobranchus kaupii TaxID=118154 RepID=A0A9Q1FKW3_SYNKA|nr:hypothetical protein SKAU_G00173570 [Synaphobranchus kaupii]
MTTTNLRNRWSSSSSEDEDDLVCEYDSTWEETGCDYKEENSQRHRWRRNSRAARDMQTYRHGYPVREQEKYQSSIWYAHSDLDRGEQMVNLRFYRNDIPSSPDKVYITEFHKCWKGDYKRLERVHSYIQWLFPLQEPGMNYSAQVLTKNEVKAFCEDQEAKERLVTSYELMLDFYGIELVNKSTGEVARSENWMEQFDNLNRNTHNNLRITRILKSLGDLGFQHYQAPLVKFFLEETLIHGNLAYVKQSVMDYFLFAVLNKKKRRELIEYAFRHYKPRFEFVWCPKKIQRRLLIAEKNQDDLDQEKGGLLGESGCDQENETNVTEESPATSNAFQYQASSVDPLESFSVEQPPPVNRVMDQPSSPDSGSLNEESTSEGHIQGPGVEHSPPLQELVTDETAQEVGTEAKTESSRVPVETQSNSQDIKKNSTTDDTSAAEQEPALEMQNKKEMGGMGQRGMNLQVQLKTITDLKE